MKKAAKTPRLKPVVNDEIVVIDQFRTEVFKKTDDDWCPSYLDDNGVSHVKVSLLRLTGSKYTHRVCVWGNDDYGLEKDFDDELKGSEMFELIAGQEKLNIKDLKDLGFSPA